MHVGLQEETTTPNSSNAALALTQEDIALIVKEINLGNSTAFKKFFLELYPEVFCFLYRYTRDREAAKDLTQEAFVRFWHARERIDADQGPRIYLYRIARNLALDNAREQKRTRRTSDLAEDILVRLSYDPSDAYDCSLAADKLQQSLSLLPERCRAVFILSRYHDFSYQQIARSLDISIQTVKNQMNKALSLLRKCLADELE